MLILCVFPDFLRLGIWLLSTDLNSFDPNIFRYVDINVHTVKTLSRFVEDPDSDMFSTAQTKQFQLSGKMLKMTHLHSLPEGKFQLK